MDTPSHPFQHRARTLYVRASDPECALPGGDLVAQIGAELHRLRVTAAGPRQLADLRERTTVWAADETRRHHELFEYADRQSRDEGARAALTRRAVLGCAPLALASGAWLQWLSAAGNSEDPLVLRVLTSYADDVGVGHPHASRGNAYLGLLRHLRLAENAVPFARVALDQRVSEGSCYLPALLLAMGRRPEDFLPEVVGADLCLRTVGLLPALAPVRSAYPAATDWTAVDPGAARSPGHEPAAEMWAVATQLAEAGERIAHRLVLGFGWALAAMQRWSSDLYGEMEAARNPAYDMVALIQLRAREGSVYHQDFPLRGRPLSEWLTEARTDPMPLLDALATSPLVKPGRPQASALVNGLVGERGPMFRVFAPDDLTVIRRWIAGLPVAGCAVAREPIATPSASYRAAPLTLPALDADPAEVGRPPTDLREAYHLLLNRTDTPAVRRYAIGYVRSWLARSRHRINRCEHIPPARWHPEGLRPWLQEQHDRHGRDFSDRVDAPLPSREDLIDTTVQLAPLTLIDGAWLQGFTDYEQATSEQGHFLFKTYWDELGNGQPSLNHPRIYRAVLSEMGVDLPPTASVEFARWPGFRDASFALPVYWLCVGRFPRTFGPEVLGLNLAMELSGVGGTYRSARIALKHHGFSTQFVDIHNTIDNVATGHSAWAADAIDTHLTTIAATQPAEALATTWQRVRVGYRSLNPPSGFWARIASRREPQEEATGV